MMGISVKKIIMYICLLLLESIYDHTDMYQFLEFFCYWDSQIHIASNQLYLTDLKAKCIEVKP